MSEGCKAQKEAAIALQVYIDLCEGNIINVLVGIIIKLFKTKIIYS